jgi:hypothetical protein
MRRFGNRYLSFSLGLGFLTVCSATLAYYRIFTGFAEWDDEGTLMMTVRQYLTGGTLYENVRSGYGPVYYFYNWLIRTLTSTSVTHDVTRLTSMVIWTVCSLACAWIVWRLGGSLAVALLCQFLVFRILAFFRNEPGHPQELCMLLLVALAASGLFAASYRHRRLAALLAGALPAALMLVKINIGIFAILAVSLAMLYHVPQGRLVTILRYLAGGASLVLPILLMRTHLNDPSEVAYCVAVSAGIAALLTGVVKPVPLFSYEDCALAVGAFAVTGAAVLGMLLVQGVSPSAILTSLVLQHVQLSVKQGNWYVTLGLSPWWLVWAIAAPVLAVVVTRRPDRASAPYKLPAVPVAVISAAALLIAGLGSRHMFGLIIPFCWILACTPAGNGSKLIYARTLLASLAILQTLYAYPVAGSQAPFTSILLIVVAGVCLADALSGLPGLVHQGTFPSGVAAAVVAIVLLSYPLQIWRARLFYGTQTPLNLPGAARIRATPAEVETFHWLVAELKQYCDTFVGYPGIPSLYFWTGKPMPGPVTTPPGPLNADAWTLLLTPAQQQPIVDEFARHPNGCVVYHPSGVSFWNLAGIDESPLPLVSFIQHNFRTVGTMGDYQFQVRKDRPWPSAMLH